MLIWIRGESSGPSRKTCVSWCRLWHIHSSNQHWNTPGWCVVDLALWASPHTDCLLCKSFLLPWHWVVVVCLRCSWPIPLYTVSRWLGFRKGCFWSHVGRFHLLPSIFAPAHYNGQWTFHFGSVICKPSIHELIPQHGHLRDYSQWTESISDIDHDLCY